MLLSSLIGSSIASKALLIRMQPRMKLSKCFNVMIQWQNLRTLQEKGHICVKSQIVLQQITEASILTLRNSQSKFDSKKWPEQHQNQFTEHLCESSLKANQ